LIDADVAIDGMDRLEQAVEQIVVDFAVRNRVHDRPKPPPLPAGVADADVDRERLPAIGCEQLSPGSHGNRKLRIPRLQFDRCSMRRMNPHGAIRARLFHHEVEWGDVRRNDGVAVVGPNRGRPVEGGRRVEIERGTVPNPKRPDTERQHARGHDPQTNAFLHLGALAAPKDAMLCPKTREKK